MSRFMLGATVVGVVLTGLAATQARATDLPRCAPHHHHRHVVARRHDPQIVYGRTGLVARRPVYNYEDNGQYDGGDLPTAAGRVAAGQGASWLDGYGTQQTVYPGYGPYSTYGGSAQRWPSAIPPGGGLAVYIPGAYGPGPRIIQVPGAY